MSKIIMESPAFFWNVILILAGQMIGLPRKSGNFIKA